MSSEIPETARTCAAALDPDTFDLLAPHEQRRVLFQSRAALTAMATTAGDAARREGELRAIIRINALRYGPPDLTHAQIDAEIERVMGPFTHEPGFFARPSLGWVLAQVGAEVSDAESKWPAMNSAHEAYAVLLEEVDELWTEVKVNQKRRDMVAMRKESLQVAAMAVRFVRDVCDIGMGAK